MKQEMGVKSSKSGVSRTRKSKANQIKFYKHKTSLYIKVLRSSNDMALHSSFLVIKHLPSLKLKLESREFFRGPYRDHSRMAFPAMEEQEIESGQAASKPSVSTS